MKKLLLILVVLFSTFTYANAQERTKISDGVYMVMYGNKMIFEDDVRGQSYSVEVYQEVVDYRNEKIAYTVICGKYTKTVFQEGLKRAIEGALSSAGAPWAGYILAAAAEKGYDYMCYRWGKKFDD